MAPSICSSRQWYLCWFVRWKGLASWLPYLRELYPKNGFKNVRRLLLILGFYLQNKDILDQLNKYLNTDKSTNQSNLYTAYTHIYSSIRLHLTTASRLPACLHISALDLRPSCEESKFSTRPNLHFPIFRDGLKWCFPWPPLNVEKTGVRQLSVGFHLLTVLVFHLPTNARWQFEIWVKQTARQTAVSGMKCTNGRFPEFATMLTLYFSIPIFHVLKQKSFLSIWTNLYSI